MAFVCFDLSESVRFESGFEIRAGNRYQDTHVFSNENTVLVEPKHKQVVPLFGFILFGFTNTESVNLINQSNSSDPSNAECMTFEELGVLISVAFMMQPRPHV
jgi:hypothetical protein